jgi:probable O-glycosylation ligase (exosortase A-associated)
MKGLVLIYAITVLGSLGALRKPIIGLYIYVGFAVLRPQFIWGWAGDFEGISLYIGIATLVGWILSGFGSKAVGPGKSIVALLVIFTAWTTLAATQAVNTEVAYATLVPLMKFVMPFMIGITLLDSEGSARTMLWVMVLAMGYVSFEMNLEYFRGNNVAGEGFGGMDNNCFGVALVSAIGPAVALGLGATKWSERVAAGVSAALILHATLLTFSRGAMVGLLAVGATAFVVMPKRPKHIAALVLVGLIALRLTGPQLMARYATTTAESDQRDDSAESRLDLWADCLKLAAEHPLFGVGPANFHVVAASLGWTAGKEAHSTWMQQMAETGFPGVLILFSFFAVAVVKLWPIARARPSPENRPRIAVATGLIMSIVGFAVAGQFVSLAGLEIPYYATMIGVVLLKYSQPLPAVASHLVQVQRSAAGKPARAAAAMRPLRN